MAYDADIHGYAPSYHHDARRAEFHPTSAMGSTLDYYPPEHRYSAAHEYEGRHYDESALTYPRHAIGRAGEPLSVQFSGESDFRQERRHIAYPDQVPVWSQYDGRYVPQLAQYSPAAWSRPRHDEDYPPHEYRPNFPVLTSAATPQQPRPPSVSHSAASWDYSQRPYTSIAAEVAPVAVPHDDGRSYLAQSGAAALSAETAPPGIHAYTRPTEDAVAYPPASDAYDVHHVPDHRAFQPLPSPPQFPTNLPPRSASLDGPPPTFREPEPHEETYVSTYEPPEPVAAPYRQPAVEPPPPLTFQQHYPQRPVSQPARLSSSHTCDHEPNSTLATLQEAFRERTMHNSSAPILAFNPAREPSASGKQLVATEFGVTFAVAGSGQGKGKVKSAEVLVACKTCDVMRVKCIMRGADLGGWMPRVNFKCLDCLPPEAYSHDAAASEARDERLAARAFEEFQQPSTSSSAPSLQSVSPPPPPQQHEHDKITFRDTFSGAVDEIVRSQTTPAFGTSSLPPDDPYDSAGNPQSRLLLPPEETAKGLSASFKRQALCCDVCSRIVGAGSIESLSAGPAPAFTVESICRSCLERYRPCSDCGGGGGRLTPGRWRCKELFPANRRTCTLSHARNPPLADIDYDVLRITEIDPSKLASLDEQLRKIYYNVRMRMQARPEMLERGDGLATTFAQVEKLIIDGWTLLRPLLFDDVEASRGLRRYVALQTSTPHKRRAKPKPGALPKPEPAVPKVDPVERQVSGFLLLEHELATGAVHVAVTMPWAISGDAFDATTILLDETLKRLRRDLAYDNAYRAKVSGGRDPPLPDPTYLWGITPFKGDSRMTQSLTRRGFHFVEDRLREDPDFDTSIFPPSRTVHVPNEFMRSFRIFLRDVTEDDGRISGVGAESASRKRAAGADGTGKPPPKKRARHLKAKPQ